MRPPTLTREQALERLMALCARAEKSPYELSIKLTQWGLTASESESIMKQLTEGRFLSTERFAQAYARDKMRFNRWGRLKIRYQLKGHHIPPPEIEAALNLLDEAEYQEMIAGELQKKLHALKIRDPWQQKTRLFSFGTQRGYEPDLMNHFFSQVGLE